MTVNVPRLEVGQTSISTRGLFLGLAVVRAVMAGGALLAALGSTESTPPAGAAPAD